VEEVRMRSLRNVVKKKLYSETNSGMTKKNMKKRKITAKIEISKFV
jgi:hypothetical protein